ncbi:hypothetical protein EB06_01078 [Enterococcus cecorum]|nr:hypothetical protein EB06_01078 [Enterococcus cecorum]
MDAFDFLVQMGLMGQPQQVQMKLEEVLIYQEEQYQDI